MRAGSRIVLFIGLISILNLAGADWPHWRGPDRNGISTESSSWNDGKWNIAGPLWKANVGEGASAPLVVGDTLFCIGWKEGKDIVRALDLNTGQVRWQQSYPSPRYGRFATGDQGYYTGATATPEFDPDSGLLFTLSCDGELRAWNTRDDGKSVWSLNLYDRYGIKRRPQITSRKNTLRDYGYTCAPIVIGDQLIVETGDRDKGTIKAFHCRTGELLWSSQNRDPAGHSGGFAPMRIDGVPCVAVATSWNALVVRIDGKNAGETVAEYEWKTDFSNTIASVTVEKQDLVISSRYNQMAMARVHISLKEGAREVWRNRHPTGVCTPVISGGNLYFANKGIHCIDFATGKLKWEGGSIGDAGSCILTADDRLVVWGNGGDLLLVEGAGRSPDQCQVLEQKKRVLRDKAWPHIVLAQRHLLGKTVSGDLVAFALDREAQSSSPSAPSLTGLEKWPVSKPVIGWRQGGGVAGCFGDFRRARVQLRDSAKFGENGELQLSGGAAIPGGISTTVLDALQSSNQLTVELILQPVDLNQRGPARILTFSKDLHNRNFTIGQNGDEYVLRLRTSTSKTHAEIPLCASDSSRPQHLVVTWKEGGTAIYLDGKLHGTSDRIKGDFSNWYADHHLLLGDEWSGGNRNWSGAVFGFAVFDKVLSASEVERNYRSAFSVR